MLHWNGTSFQEDYDKLDKNAPGGAQTPDLRITYYSAFYASNA